MNFSSSKPNFQLLCLKLCHRNAKSKDKPIQEKFEKYEQIYKILKLTFNKIWQKYLLLQLVHKPCELIWEIKDDDFKKELPMRDYAIKLHDTIKYQDRIIMDLFWQKAEEDTAANKNNKMKSLLLETNGKRSVTTSNGDLFDDQLEQVKRYSLEAQNSNDNKEAEEKDILLRT